VCQGSHTNVRETAQETHGEIFSQNPNQITPTKAQNAVTVAMKATGAFG